MIYVIFIKYDICCVLCNFAILYMLLWVSVNNVS